MTTMYFNTKKGWVMVHRLGIIWDETFATSKRLCTAKAK